MAGMRVMAVAGSTGRLMQARVVCRCDTPEGYIAIYVRLLRQVYCVHPDGEGTAWCRGWTGSAIDALRAATALGEKPALPLGDSYSYTSANVVGPTGLIGPLRRRR